jgi:hypothetical protein
MMVRMVRLVRFWPDHSDCTRMRTRSCQLTLLFLQLWPCHFFTSEWVTYWTEIRKGILNFGAIFHVLCCHYM